MAPKKEKWAKAGKTLNLTKKQVAAGRRVGKAGQSKVRAGEVKKARKSVNISNTTWRKASERTGPRAKGGILVNRAGKPVTGTVTLASGARATYVRGKRVAAAKKTAAPRSGGGGGGGRTTTTAVNRPRFNTPDAVYSGNSSRRPISSDNLRSMGRARSIARRTGSQQAARQASTIAATGRPMSRPAYTTGQGRAVPKKGQERAVKRGGVTAIEKWDGTKWVTKRVVRH